MIAVDKARRAIARAEEVGLDGAEWLAALGAEEVAAACNGCGPEWLHEDLRTALTGWLDLFFAAFCLHDCRFQYRNNGTRALFDEANDELERNMLLLADDAFAWFDPRRYLWRHRARVVALVCRDFGWSAWRSAYGATKGETK